MDTLPEAAMNSVSRGYLSGSLSSAPSEIWDRCSRHHFTRHSFSGHQIYQSLALACPSVWATLVKIPSGENDGVKKFDRGLDGKGKRRQLVDGACSVVIRYAVSATQPL